MQPPGQRLDAIGESAQARAFGGVGASDAVVDDLDDELGVLSGDPDDGRFGVCVLRDVGERLANEVVRGHLDGRRRAVVE